MSRQQKVRPILYQPAMVLAKVRGLKTQTRRIKGKLQLINENLNYTTWSVQKRIDCGNEFFVFKTNGIHDVFVGCPYGQKGDLLWGKETLYYDSHSGDEWCYQAGNDPVLCEYEKQLLRTDKKSISSRYMPKVAARIWDEVVDVRAERLHDISEADCQAEGIEVFRQNDSYQAVLKGIGTLKEADPRKFYAQYFNQINGLRQYENPWVWVIETKSVTKPIN